MGRKTRHQTVGKPSGKPKTISISEDFPVPEDYNFGGRLRPPKEQLGWDNLLQLKHDRLAFCYKRLSTHEQTKKSIFSLKMQDALVDLAREDGYPPDMIVVEDRDLGISGTKGHDVRTGLAHLIRLIEQNKVEAVYVVHVSRLYRDQTLIDAFAFGELCKKHNVLIITPQMRLNLADDMHMRIYRMEVERSAEELKVMAGRMQAAQALKARQGFYAGASLPRGYVYSSEEVINSTRELDKDSQHPQIYEPHAEVIRFLFHGMRTPGMGAAALMRRCREQGIAFKPLPPALAAIRANLKSFIPSKVDANGVYPITMDEIRRVCLNPAYIGWLIWSGQVIATDHYPPTIDEATFWEVQKKFNRSSIYRHKEQPVPLAGLLYHTEHSEPILVTYSRRGSNKYAKYDPRYVCYRDVFLTNCFSIGASILQEPIFDLVLQQCSLTDVAERVKAVLATQYQEAKEQADHFQRDVERLTREIENLQSNFYLKSLSPDRAAWIEQEIARKETERRRLASLDSQPIAQLIGRRITDEELDLVADFLANFSERWDKCPDRLKNVFLRLVLERIDIVEFSKATITMVIRWKMGLAQAIKIYRPVVDVRRPWTEEQDVVLREMYFDRPRDEIMERLPGRYWRQVLKRASKLGLSRSEAIRYQESADFWIGPYSEEELTLVRAFYNGDITYEELAGRINRSITSIRGVARKLGLHRKKKIRWEFLPDYPLSDSEGPAFQG